MSDNLGRSSPMPFEIYELEEHRGRHLDALLRYAHAHDRADAIERALEQLDEAIAVGAGIRPEQLRELRDRDLG